MKLVFEFDKIGVSIITGKSDDPDEINETLRDIIRESASVEGGVPLWDLENPMTELEGQRLDDGTYRLTMTFSQEAQEMMQDYGKDNPSAFLSECVSSDLFANTRYWQENKCKLSVRPA